MFQAGLSEDRISEPSHLLLSRRQQGISTGDMLRHGVVGTGKVGDPSRACVTESAVDSSCCML